MDQTVGNIAQTDANMDITNSVDQADNALGQLDVKIDESVDQTEAKMEHSEIYAQAAELANMIQELPTESLDNTVDKVVDIINTVILNRTSGRLSLIVQSSNCAETEKSSEPPIEVKKEPESEHEDEFENIFNEVIKSQNTIETTALKRPRKPRKAKTKGIRKLVSKAVSKTKPIKRKSVNEKDKTSNVVSNIKEENPIENDVVEEDENYDDDNDYDFDPNEIDEEIKAKQTKKLKLRKAPKRTKPLSGNSNIGDYAIAKPMDPLPCVVCIDEPSKSIQYTRMKDLMNHIMDTHTFTPEGKLRPHLRCYIQGCNKSWPYYRKKLAIQGVCGYYQYIAHLEKEHNIPKPPNIKVFECKDCNYSTIVPRNFKAHMYNKKHAYNCIPCSVCGKLIHRRNMRQHMSFIHNTGPPKTCPVCSKVYKSEETLNNHIKSIHEDSKPYLCSECPMKFLNSYSFNDHMLLKHGTNPTNREPFKCEHCDWETLNRGHLRRHLKDHHEGSVNGFICQKCGRKLRNSGSLRRHTTMYHSTKKDALQIIKCEHCSYTCRHPEYMKKHIRIHSGKRYQCDLCTYSTPYRENLPKHRRTHTNSNPPEKWVKTRGSDRTQPGFLDTNLQPPKKHGKPTVNNQNIPQFLDQKHGPHRELIPSGGHQEKMDFNSSFSTGFLQQQALIKNHGEPFGPIGAEGLGLQQNNPDNLSHIM